MEEVKFWYENAEVSQESGETYSNKRVFPAGHKEATGYRKRTTFTR